MKAAFWFAFLGAFFCTSSALAVAALFIGRAIVPEPYERFATSIFSFEMPPGWKCGREADSFTCRFGDKPPYDSIVIFAMKFRGADDNLEAYESHLRGPMERADKKGFGELKSLARRRIGGVEWVEGTVIGSEIANYETIYLAGNTAQVAMLITFSFHPSAREARLPDLEVMANTIVVNQQAY